MGDTNLTVSIIIPVYKVSAYIEDCLRSVMNQTYKHIECVLVDDASPDDSIAKCERMIAGYQGLIKFSIQHHQQNRGLSAARNTGTAAATGEYIYYLDGDDEMTNDCIEKLVNPVLKDATIEMVMGNFLRRAEGCPLDPLDRLTLSLKEEDIKSHKSVRDYYFNKGLHQTAWNKLINREFLNQRQLFFKEGILWEDTLWTFFVVKYLSHLYTIPDVTYHYIKRPFALTTGMCERDKKFHHWCIVYDEIANHITEDDRRREAKYHVKRFCYRCVDNPDNQEFIRVAKKYRKVLWEERCMSDMLVLSGMVALSRFPRGKAFFFRVAKRVITVRKT